MAPGRIVQMFKRITARELFRRKPAVKRVLWGGEFWTDGYSVATGGERANWQTVERDVQRQGQPPVKSSGSSIGFSSVIPRSLLRGASLLGLWTLRFEALRTSQSRHADIRPNRGCFWDQNDTFPA